MKHFVKGSIFFGRFANRSEDEFYGNVNEKMEAQADPLRWFGGMHDLDYTYVCQKL